MLAPKVSVTTTTTTDALSTSATFFGSGFSCLVGAAPVSLRSNASIRLAHF